MPAPWPSSHSQGGSEVDPGRQYCGKAKGTGTEGLADPAARQEQVHRPRQPARPRRRCRPGVRIRSWRGRPRPHCVSKGTDACSGLPGARPRPLHLQLPEALLSEPKATALQLGSDKPRTWASPCRALSPGCLSRKARASPGTHPLPLRPGRCPVHYPQVQTPNKITWARAKAAGPPELSLSDHILRLQGGGRPV